MRDTGYPGYRQRFILNIVIYSYFIITIIIVIPIIIIVITINAIIYMARIRSHSDARAHLRAYTPLLTLILTHVHTFTILHSKSHSPTLTLTHKTMFLTYTHCFYIISPKFHLPNFSFHQPVPKHTCTYIHTCTHSHTHSPFSRNLCCFLLACSPTDVFMRALTCSLSSRPLTAIARLW